MKFSSARQWTVKLSVIAVSGGLVAALAVPANAFNNRPEGAAVETRSAQVELVQTTSASAAVELTISRDSYTATKPVVIAASSATNHFITLNPPAQTYSGQAVVDYAMQFVGVVPYGNGNSPTDSFSCDGLTQYVFAGFGISLPRGANSQANLAVAISAADAQPGDFVWWPGQHIGIYAGGGMMVDSPTWGRYVEYHAIWGSPVYMRLV